MFSSEDCNSAKMSLSSKWVFFMSLRRLPLLALLLLGPAGCANLMSGVTSQLADDLAASILNSEDVATVREGVPAYLLLIDSFLRGSPDSPDLLFAAATLNGSFSVLVEDEIRAKLLAAKSLEHAEKAACLTSAILCGLRDQTFQELERKVTALEMHDVPVVYNLAVAWVGWIQSHSDDWAAIGELGKAKMLMAQVIVLNERHESGGPHLYMGGMETILPASLGGKPEKGRQHFEKAIEIEPRYLMTKVIYAEQYARLVFDEKLHDRLLTEVLAANPISEGMTLTNKVAQLRAETLLATSNDYF